jgi:hypothetical protein
MEHSAVMDVTLHDSGAQLEEDLAMIRGRTQVNGSVRRQTNIVVNSSDDDVEEEEEDEDDGEEEEEEDVDSFELVKGMGNKTKTSDEEFEEVVKFDDTNSEFGIPIEQTDEVSLECETDTENHIEGNTKKANNVDGDDDNDNVLHNSESEDTIKNVLTKKSILKRKKNETGSYSALNVEGSKHSKRLLVCKRKSQNSVVTDWEEHSELEEHHDRDSEDENVNSKENLKVKTKMKRHDSVNIKCRFDEGLVHNMCGEDEGVDSVCEEGSGDTVEEETGEGELWEDIYGRTRDRQGNVIQVRLYSLQTVNTNVDCSVIPLLCLLPLKWNTEMLISLCRLR